MKNFTCVILYALIPLFLLGCTQQIKDSADKYTSELAGEITDDVTQEMLDNMYGYENGTTTKKQELNIYHPEDSSIAHTISENTIITPFLTDTTSLMLETAKPWKKDMTYPQMPTCYVPMNFGKKIQIPIYTLKKDYI